MVHQTIGTKDQITANKRVITNWTVRTYIPPMAGKCALSCYYVWSLKKIKFSYKVTKNGVKVKRKRKNKQKKRFKCHS